MIGVVPSNAKVESAFKRIIGEANAIDILVNNVWGGYERDFRAVCWLAALDPGYLMLLCEDRLGVTP